LVLIPGTVLAMVALRQATIALMAVDFPLYNVDAPSQVV
jgi:hypothetical protein